MMTDIKKLLRIELGMNLYPVFLSLIFINASVNAQSTTSSATSQWVHQDPSGKLMYKTLPAGDKIMDFSYAGYMGGGVNIPSLAVRTTLSPIAGDNTEAIQNAIDEVSKMTPVNGFRGAVLLKPGRYNCEKPILIKASGVTLRGSGSGENGSIINMTGSPHACIVVRGTVASRVQELPITFSDSYVPSGASSINLTNVSGLAVGDTIRISRPVTAAWVKLMGMDTLVRDGKKQTWLTGEIPTDRVVKRISNKNIMLDIPLTDNYDAKYLSTSGVSISKVSSSGELSQIGIENLRIVSPDQSVTISEGHNRAFTMSGLSDGWARNITVLNTVNSVSVTGKRITIENVSIMHNQPTKGAAKPADLNGSGQQLFFNRCSITGDNLFFFGTGAKVTGPVVLLNCVFLGNGWIQPHQRWATGLLIDNCRVPDGGIDFMNRGIMGSGHGWTIGWAVAWNSEAKSFLNQQPPGAANWVIGSTGDKKQQAMPFYKQPNLKEGIYDSHNKPVAPYSLYLAQLSERLGKVALSNIGY